MKIQFKPSYLLIILIGIIFSPNLFAQEQFNYDESKVPALVLPDPFVSSKGEIIKTVDDWESLRRPELMRLFTENVYGPIPRDFDDIRFDHVKENSNPYPDLAILREVDIAVLRNCEMHTMRLNVFIPKTGQAKYPVFLLINHRSKDPNEILIEDGFWAVKELLERGYATASFHVDTVSPDDKDTFHKGVISNLYPEELEKPDGMRTLAAWAWGAMRAMDYFEWSDSIDENRAVIVGHSRGGKAALWCGANDERWSVVIPNESGCGGAALSRRRFGETVKRINTNFPYWFNDNFKTFNDREDALPIDQHLLAACIAPRSIYFASAIEDQWADPKGEFMSLKLGSRVYSEIYGIKVDLPESFENHQRTIHTNSVGYHFREGKHNLTLYDWEMFMDFVDKEFLLAR
jgi:hypothetical protein